MAPQPGVGTPLTNPPSEGGRKLSVLKVALQPSKMRASSVSDGGVIELYRIRVWT